MLRLSPFLGKIRPEFAKRDLDHLTEVDVFAGQRLFDPTCVTACVITHLRGTVVAIRRAADLSKSKKRWQT